MAIVENSVAVDAPVADLFSLSQDESLRKRWDPFVRGMRLVGGASKGTRGARVWVRAWTGMTMEVVFTSFRPPRSVAMKMVRGPWLFRSFAGTWLFHALPGGRTRITFRYRFVVGGGLLSPLVDRLVAWIFRRDVRARLRGLKRGAEREGLLAELAERPYS